MEPVAAIHVLQEPVKVRANLYLVNRVLQVLTQALQEVFSVYPVTQANIQQ